MYLKRLEIIGFKSFARKGIFSFDTPVSAIVGPNGSGKSNVAEAIRFVLGEQSQKRLRSKRGEDLIWNGTGQTPRGNQASVSIIFDNSGKEFELDYDEVEIKRQVFRDGSNHYFINGAHVRLRDIIELLARVHIGATGHHIISQGEADRILNANVKDRRTMIEEALGLKIYQWKIDESEKKLSKTQENLKQVESLRREISPHIRFLKKQVERIEKAKEMRSELSEMYSEYLKREHIYVGYERSRIKNLLVPLQKELSVIEDDIARSRSDMSKSEDANSDQMKLVDVEKSMSSAGAEKGELSRAVGRLEGMIEYEEKRFAGLKRHNVNKTSVDYKDVRDFVDTVKKIIDEAESSDLIEGARAILARVRASLENFLLRINIISEDNIDKSELDALRAQKKEAEDKLSEMSLRMDEFTKEYKLLKRAIERKKNSTLETERALFEMTARKSELSAEIGRLKDSYDMIDRAERELKEEMKEGLVLIGSDITSYEKFVIDERDVVSEDRSEQENRRRQIEKIKIKLEDMGAGGGGDIVKEYEETLERDKFLEREIGDLGRSADALKVLIKELAEKLDQDFKNGIAKINTQFQDFFMLMFGGGTAKLSVVSQRKRRVKDIDIGAADDEFIAEQMEEESEDGIDISVTLPRKKIKGLHMLSGGERALTSIALIFAVSQVNPPPFLVLDETDAALDEANSRRYGDMLENLARYSQLIVITHNRETMSRAGVLYGVTMGSDAVSKLLSVKFDEAAAFAK